MMHSVRRFIALGENQMLYVARVNRASVFEDAAEFILVVVVLDDVVWPIQGSSCSCSCSWSTRSAGNDCGGCKDV